jgi:hypothetical protein
MPLRNILENLAQGLLEFDLAEPIYRNYNPGVGPHPEVEQIRSAINRVNNPGNPLYGAITEAPYPNTNAQCDLLIPEEYAIEFKLLRPLGDNGRENSTQWFSDVVCPLSGNRSAIGDCLKLINSGFAVRKAVVLIAYYPATDEERFKINKTIDCFELIAREICDINLGNRIHVEFAPLVHTFHQVGELIGWEIR